MSVFHAYWILGPWTVMPGNLLIFTASLTVTVSALAVLR